jgi:CRP/FNR family cyclic AMP-dependent transcriptional regulator
MRRRFETGEALFRQGDPSDVALQILSGSVDVLREVGDDAIVLGTVRAGEFVGEMGVLEGRTRSATVRAAGPVEAELIERQALARKLLLRMSARLRDVEDTLTGLYARDSEDAPRRDLVETPRPAPGAPSLMLRAATERARGVLGADLMPITRLPFTVGRTPADDEAPAFIAVDLAIPEPQPYRLSRAHFSLVAQGDEVVVRDLASKLGTIVNDRPLGWDFPSDSAPLHQGENIIVAGGSGSPFVFAVTLS